MQQRFNHERQEKNIREVKDMKTHKELLLNLLATIHRDGGHYVDDHGVEKATEDAMKKVVAWIHKVQPIQNGIKYV